MRIFADTSDVAVMQNLADQVDGFTTNPSLMRAAGVTDYESFAKECVAKFPNHSFSFEVIADDLDTMYGQACKIATWGDNVYVKIPVSTTDGRATDFLVSDLSLGGVKVNVTAIFTQAQINVFGNALKGGAPAYLSIFAGRIADTGHDPTQLISNASMYARQNVRVLWASAREILNVQQARRAGADIITLTPELLAKQHLYGKDLTEYSLETVKMFRDDAIFAGLTL